MSVGQGFHASREYVCMEMIDQFCIPLIKVESMAEATEQAAFGAIFTNGPSIWVRWLRRHLTPLVVLMYRGEFPLRYRHDYGHLCPLPLGSPRR